MIELKQLSAGYGKQPVLTDISAVFEKGKLTCVIGVNGCGKSTLLKTMLGMLPLPGGEILVDDHSLEKMTRTEIARKMAYLPQEKSTPDMTVEQMVLHGRFPHLRYPRQYTGEDRKIAFSAMEQAGISHLAQKDLRTLSGGMRQNAYIAMALAQGTDYILLDEPTTYLDISHQLSLMKTLRALADAGKGVIVVLHDLPLAFTFADEILLLHNRKVIQNGPPEQVCTRTCMQEIFGAALLPVSDGQGYRYDYGS